MTKQVFYDPQRKRWTRLRRIFDVLALAGCVIGVIFVVGLVRMTPLPELFFSTPKHAYTPASTYTATLSKAAQKRRARRKNGLKASDITLNSGQGVRAAYYVEDDPASYSSLKEHIHQIDLLFPEWLHVVSPDGTLTSYSLDNRPFSVVDGAGVHAVDHEGRVEHVIKTANEDTEVFPLINNFDPVRNEFLPTIGDFLTNPGSRANFIQQVDRFLAGNPAYRGISLDFERYRRRRSKAISPSSPICTRCCTRAS